MTKQVNLRQIYNTATMTIANAAAVSDTFDAEAFGGRGFSVQTPAAWTAADIAFEVSENDSDWFPVYNDLGTRVKITNVATAAAQAYIAPAEAWVVGAYKHARLASINTATGANENQGAARTLILKALS
jgi:hypothetical protein